MQAAGLHRLREQDATAQNVPAGQVVGYDTEIVLSAKTGE